MYAHALTNPLIRLEELMAATQDQHLQLQVKVGESTGRLMEDRKRLGEENKQLMGDRRDANAALLLAVALTRKRHVCVSLDWMICCSIYLGCLGC
jgi:hypothetical protein